MTSLRICFFLLILTSFTSNASIAFKDDIPKIKVKLASNLSKVRIKGTDIETKSKTSEIKRKVDGKGKLIFNCDKLSKKHSGIKIASLSSPTGLIALDDFHYRGELEVHASSISNSCDVINSVSLEHYISTLLAKEMNGKWPIEALKAQAVAARSYAYHLMTIKPESAYHLVNSEFDQVNGSFFDETIYTFRASRETQGEILTTKSGNIIPAFYHSKCGGHTYTPEEVWGGGKRYSGYTQVKCNYCKGHGISPWNYTLSFAEFNKIVIKALGKNYESKVGAIFKINKTCDDSSIISFNVGPKTYTIDKAAFRKSLGRSKLPSNNFKMELKSFGILISGSGFGHGVGMCQYGAYEMAKRGYNYKEILKHYFPEHIISKIY